MSLNVKSITETARYSLTTFIATIGGSMGAWVGFSVCMVFEVPACYNMSKFYKSVCTRDLGEVGLLGLIIVLQVIELLIDLGGRMICPGKM